MLVDHIFTAPPASAEHEAMAVDPGLTSTLSTAADAQCSSNVHRTTFEWMSQMYTIPSSEAPTTHWAPLGKCEKNAYATQNVQFVWPRNVFTHIHGPRCRNAHNFTWLSKVATSKNLPFGENLMKETAQLALSISVFRHWPVPVSHSLQSPSKLHETINDPSRLNSTAVTGSECAGSDCKHRPDFASHTRTVSSNEPLATKFDCGLKLTHTTNDACP